MTIYPLKGNEKFVAKALLDLADNASDVQVDSRPQQEFGSVVGFRVPVELFNLFTETMSGKMAEVVAPAQVSEGAAHNEDIDSGELEVKPIKPVKRAGRPKKVEEAE